MSHERKKREIVVLYVAIKSHFEDEFVQKPILFKSFF